MIPRSTYGSLSSAHFLLALGALLIAAAVGVQSGKAQSFDCRYAHYANEKTICQEPALGQLVHRL